MNNLDQFYTKTEIAEKCYNLTIEHTNINDYNYILEPSAGTGSFYKLLPEKKRIGLDLEPKYKGVLEMDYFDFRPDYTKKYMVYDNRHCRNCTNYRNHRNIQYGTN